jgi:hypothetical protein
MKTGSQAVEIFAFVAVILVAVVAGLMLIGAAAADHMRNRSLHDRAESFRAQDCEQVNDEPQQLDHAGRPMTYWGGMHPSVRRSMGRR